MSYSDHCISDYMRGVSLDIGQAFFPPPVLVVSSALIPSPADSLSLEYDFSAEKVALEKYAKSMEAKSVESTLLEKGEEKSADEKTDAAASLKDNSGINGISQPQPIVSEQQSVPRNSEQAGKPSWPPTEILQPQPFTGHHQRRPSSTDQQQVRALRLLSLEDFESSTSPFDALEIKTIDDRAMLKQVLDSR